MKRTKITTVDTASEFNILTNDPSFTGWGWAVLTNTGRIKQVGCIKTEPSHKKFKIRKGDDRVQRIGLIVQELMDVIRTYDVKYILSELPHGSQNAQAAMMVGATAAIVQTISVITDIGVEWYSEADCKKCIFGRQSASKSEMIEKMKDAYTMSGCDWFGIKYKDEAVADALSIHYTAIRTSPTLKAFQKWQQ